MKIKSLLPVIFTWCAVLVTHGPAFGQQWLPATKVAAELWSVASSSDGSKLVATAANLFSQTRLIWLSVDSGGSWTITTNSVSSTWTSVASSADGNKLALALDHSLGGIYTSTNAGATWVSNNVPNGNLKFWISIASSADGTKLFAVGNGGALYSSTNGGGNWRSNSMPIVPWVSVACSADGATVVAAANYISPWSIVIISTNSGATWTAINAPKLGWSSVACSADGKKMVLVASTTEGSPSGVYTSADSGVTWLSNNVPTIPFGSVASSDDGMKLVAAASNGPIYTSTNGGVTWLSNSAPSLQWKAVASSADGTKLVAVERGGAIYVSHSTPAPVLTLTPSGTNAVLSWLIPSLPFTLQQNPDLTTTNWTAVTNPPVLNLTNLHNEVTLQLPDNNTFYRLQSSR